MALRALSLKQTKTFEECPSRTLKLDHDSKSSKSNIGEEILKVSFLKWGHDFDISKEYLSTLQDSGVQIIALRTVKCDI